MKKAKLAAVFVAATMALATSACGDDDSSGGSSGGAKENPKIAIVSKGFQHQFWQAVKKGADQEATKEGVRISFEGPATESDIEQQVTMLTNALATCSRIAGVTSSPNRSSTSS